MNKIYSDQIAKATSLSAGIKSNAKTLQEKGINIDTSPMDVTCRTLEEIALRQEEAETALKEVRMKAHEALDQLKELINDNKTPIKLNFAPEQWAKFGIADKR